MSASPSPQPSPQPSSQPSWWPSLAEDHHVHSTFSDDAVSTPQENHAAAVERGLRRIRMVDHVRATTSDVAQRLEALARLPRTAGLVVETGVEAKILDVAGGVDAPPDVLRAAGGPGGVDRVLLADHQLPGPDGPWSPRRAREAMADGLAAADVLAMLVDGTVAALRRTPCAQLAHPLSLVPKLGLTEDDVTDEHLDAVAAAVLAAGALVEVNEKWRCPGPRAVARWRAAGVPLVASTDAHDARDVGVYDWLRTQAGTGEP
ncbi:PHP domain-containing protein [Cellulomonas palmilytica]|uniref:PHP domain-containing protein n=1 Tax=Cellulomonas palmilytica TaxID=2608402 RepID=UPI001F22C910|nr:PHP domain-containing protein [Cellulomonas palmilytica]